MVPATTSDDNSSLIKDTRKWIVNTGINGLGVLPSAQEGAKDHLTKAASVEDAINSVIAWRTTSAVGTGFITGLGGIAAIPITIPASFAASYVIAANTAATIAVLRGYDTDSEELTTYILLCLLGGKGQDILKQAGIKVGTRFSYKLIKTIPTKTLIEINKRIGIRLITKSGEKGIVNLTKMVPLVGGVIGGTFDGIYVKTCGEAAKKLFVKD